MAEEKKNNKIVEAADNAMDEIEETVLTYLDGLMFHHLSSKKSENKKVYCQKSKIEFYIDKEGEFRFGIKGEKPFSVAAKNYERPDFENVIICMVELESGIKPMLDDYRACMKISKKGEGNVPDCKKSMDAAKKILRPYELEIEKIYKMDNIV